MAHSTFKPCIFKLFLAGIIFSIALPSAIAVGLGTYDNIIKHVDFAPGQEARFQYFITQTTGRQMDYSFYKSGDLSQYVEFDPPIIQDIPISNSPVFQVILRFPLTDEGIMPGMHTIMFGVQEQLPPALSGGIGLAATTSMQTAIRIRVLFSNKSVEASLAAPSVSEGGDAVISSGARSWSKLDIDEAYMSIAVIDEAGKIIKTFVTEKQRIPAGQSISFLPIIWSTLGRKAGVYTLQGTLYFDGFKTDATGTFKIGELVIHVEDYTKAITAGRINDVSVTLSSNWNHAIDNVYYVLESSKAKKNIRSPNFKIDPFGRATVNVYWDASEDIPGDYGITITSYYEGKTSVKKGLLKILLPEALRHLEQPSMLGFGVMLIIVALLIILIVTNLYWLLWAKRRKKDKEKEGQNEQEQNTNNTN